MLQDSHYGRDLLFIPEREQAAKEVSFNSSNILFLRTPGWSKTRLAEQIVETKEGAGHSVSFVWRRGDM